MVTIQTKKMHRKEGYKILVHLLAKCFRQRILPDTAVQDRNNNHIEKSLV